jgi:UDP-glucose 4-epimerase
MRDKKILIIGGSGSLGNELIKRYISKNKIIIYSRDECKHWKMSLFYNSSNLTFIIGCIRDYARIESTLLTVKPDVVIVAAALKHIDRCEYAVNECYLTNFVGPHNVFNIVEKYQDILTNMESVVFVSTDKACNPVNTYGICKALSEKSCIEKSLTCPRIKFVCVRYGNVLNSRGSIIPILHEKGSDPKYTEFTLTSTDMTRFIMTLEQSVDLIENAVLYGETGDVVIPQIISMKLIDLFEIFSEIYDKPITITGLRPGEKILETLINETQSSSMIENRDYYYLKPSYKGIRSLELKGDYSSDRNTVTKSELKEFLIRHNLLVKSQ